jgi:NADH-quinone oxidoreductase subunit D
MAVTDTQKLTYIAGQAADARVNVELQTEDMTLNLGPQHPATHGTLRIVAKLDGEQVVEAEVVCGYMHRGYEKLTEFRTYPQVTTLINRIDWLSSFANEVPFILAAEQLMEIEAPPRAQYIRTILFELSRIANVTLFIGEMGVQLGAITPVFFAFRDREHVLNLIESATGGRFHPNYDRIGGLKDDLPKGWVADTHGAMTRIRGYCDQLEDLLMGNAIFEARTRGVGVIPKELGLAYGRPAPTSGPAVSTGTYGATRSRPSCGASSTGRSGPTPTATRSPATGSGSRRYGRPPRWSTKCSTGFPPVRSRPRSPASSRCPPARRGPTPRTRSARWGTTW